MQLIFGQVVAKPVPLVVARHIVHPIWWGVLLLFLTRLEQLSFSAVSSEYLMQELHLPFRNLKSNFIKY